MAIALNGGHVARAIDFYHSNHMYFIIGGTEPWEDETNPPSPSITDFKLVDVVGLKKVDDIQYVIPHASGTIQYRDQNWKIISESISTTVGTAGVSAGSFEVPVASVTGLYDGAKVRINNLYEGTIVTGGIVGLTIKLDTSAPADIPAGAPVLAGAMVEGAKYVYVKCSLQYNKFPLITGKKYRQIGLCTDVVAATGIAEDDILRAAAYSDTGKDEYSSLGVLEVLDNRKPASRDPSQTEVITLIIEF